MSTNPSTETTADVYTVDGGIEVRAEGMNEPALFLDADIENVLDNEGDVWVQADFSGRYYLPDAPYFETPEDADATLEEIEEEHGLADVNVKHHTNAHSAPRIEPAEPEQPAPLYHRGDVTVNTLTGREALVLRSQYLSTVGQHVYTVIEKGYSYPTGCSTIPGAGTFPEEFLAPTGQPPFPEAETTLLALVYTGSTGK